MMIIAKIKGIIKKVYEILNFEDIHTYTDIQHNFTYLWRLILLILFYINYALGKL